ncbi:YpoC family protein [Staphylococcus sp. 17KM0847]|uniref:YpoC family protein n=1 Tax=Staphylococcus sp. 17KM0847 TaxID=2583989 RepID=UPI0015DC3A13|nr:hypothetical protein [Staphylococcus sp. 17KM0847]QLK86160.1 hypothetical protein FGL66_05240 [Staphylococcus sp. 17KM0847]
MTLLKTMTQLETSLDVLAQQRKIGHPESISLLDDYYTALMQYFCMINDIDCLENDTVLKVQPFNFQERLDYIQQRKHHYMGYQQMKTLKTELVKMYAAYRAKQQR